jgi:hypothetical protein
MMKFANFQGGIEKSSPCFYTASSILQFLAGDSLVNCGKGQHEIKQR